ncbi:MAG: gliding motility lipoprotein GldH [Saprospiraceae bacterium]|nr:gliding motility lipoprotein GldH [Saprospiraceae bacterium]
MLKEIRYSAVILLTTIVLLFTSCDKNMVYEKNKKIKDGVWNNKNIVKFDVDVSDINSRNNFYINIRNSTDYTFSNVYFFIKTVFPDGGIAKDTVECFLSDVDGRWLGRGLGKFKDSRILFHKNIVFPQKGVYSFEFEQAMRVENLLGIDAVGIRIEKSDY